MADNSLEHPVVLLDGMSLAFRAFFALSSDIQTSSGLVTNALHGFASMMASLVRDHQPTSLGVAFDLPGGTFRDAMVSEYKGGRAATPPELEPQFDLIKSFCEVLRIPVIGLTGFEADDVLATLASQARDRSHNVIVVSGDRDTFQLVEDPFVRVLYNRRGVSDYALYDEAGIIERCGIEPNRYPLLAALRGDASDNLPGVPGVGEKTAARLLNQYGTLEEIFRHLDDLTPKLRENLAAHEERALNNANVMRLVRDVPLDLNVDELRLGDWRREDVHAFFERFEMNQMRSRFDRLMTEGLLGVPQGDVRTTTTTPVVSSVVAVRSVDFEEVVVGDTPLFVSFGGQRVVVLDESGRYSQTDPVNFVNRIAMRPWVGHDAKSLLRIANEHGLNLATPADDTAIMAFLVDSNSGSYDLDSVAVRYLGEGINEKAPSLLDEETDDTLIRSATLVARLRIELSRQIDELELRQVYDEIELPLIRVLARMEARGIRVDRELLVAVSEEFTAEAARLDGEIQAAAGHGFKVNSSQQLQQVLFQELHLTPTKKIKTGFSTDATSLETIVHQHPIVGLVLKYREVEKLRSTYGTSLIDTVSSDGRIHATFHQTVARTGRLSSERPNLHNIPVRSVEGRRLRYAFVPELGWQLGVSDYNQIELRILAHLSGDEGLLSAFGAHEDVHRRIAASVFSISPDEVTNEQREQAKAVSYGLAYGMEAFGLAQRLGIEVREAKDIMDRYFEGFPHLRQYRDETIRDIRQRGHSRTEFGRIRPFPDLATAVGPQRQAAERQAVNAGIQGLAADIFKSALVRLDRALEEGGFAARLVLQVHDEVLVEAPNDEIEAVSDVMKEALTKAAILRVPLEVSLTWAANWAAAKG